MATENHQSNLLPIFTKPSVSVDALLNSCWDAAESEMFPYDQSFLEATDQNQINAIREATDDVIVNEITG